MTQGVSVRRLDGFFIGGEWVPPAGTDRLEVINPTTESTLATVPAGTAADVDRAVDAARSAFDEWSTTPPAERATYLAKIASTLDARQDEIARLIASEVGTPLKLATTVQARLPVTVLNSYVDLLASYEFSEEVGNSVVLRQAAGVVGAITPWNYPLHQAVTKVAPALAAGCTVVLKPSEVAPVTAFVLAEMVSDAGMPPGVFNLVTGTGPTVGEEIAVHPDVDMISFTGSTATGRRVAALAAGTIKRVALELGGKSANVVLPDAELAAAVKVGVANCFLNSGQTCTAWSRLLVPETEHDEAVALAVRAAEHFPVGDPLVDGVRIGPLVSAAQRRRVREYIDQGVADGATLATGGSEPPEGIDRGWFVRPTVFAGVRPEMRIAQEEIFGPVLSVIPYTDEEDALRIANGTPYGLAGAVWSRDRDRAVAFARRMRAGQVDINGGRFNPLAPLGGFKQSGSGRELGRHGLEEFTEVTSLQL
jgi:aldehyde dehydrogenase (NAD+)